MFFLKNRKGGPFCEKKKIFFFFFFFFRNMKFQVKNTQANNKMLNNRAQRFQVETKNEITEKRKINRTISMFDRVSKMLEKCDV
jgi:hypothetical protein